MPQTKFVLKKHSSWICPLSSASTRSTPEARPDEVIIDEVLELLMDLDASDEQLDCPFLPHPPKMGHAVLDLNDTPKDMTPLFETILNTSRLRPAIRSWHTASISTIDYNEYVGRTVSAKLKTERSA